MDRTSEEFTEVQRESAPPTDAYHNQDAHTCQKDNHDDTARQKTKGDAGFRQTFRLSVEDFPCRHSI